MKKLYTLALAAAVALAASAKTELVPQTASAQLPAVRAVAATAAPAKAPAAKAEAKWESMGMAEFTDDIWTRVFSGAEPKTYEVEIQKDAANEGWYRLVNPL